MHLVSTRMKRIPKIAQKKHQLIEPLGVRLFMNPVHKRLGLPVIIRRHSLICRQHKVLYHPRSRIALIGTNLRRRPPLIQQNLRLRKIKINRSPLPSPPAKKSGQRFHFFKHRNQGFIFPALRLILILQNPLHTGISHPPGHPDHRLRYGMIHNFPLGIYRHNTA